MAVLQFRPYKVRDVVSTEFFVSSRYNKEWAVEDLRRSGLTLEDIFGAAPENLKLPEGAIAGYQIPYWSPDGDILRGTDNENTMYRVRYKYPEFSRANRYGQPSREQLARDGLPSFLPYLFPSEVGTSDIVYCAEGEKKTACLVKYLQVAAFGIGGCNMWGNPAGTGGVHPWILEWLSRKNARTVVIIPDGDVFRYDICTSYGTFAHALAQAGFNVQLLNPQGKIDDLILEWGAKARENLQSLPALAPSELVQTSVSLATTYDLAFKRTKDEKVIVHQHSSNVMRLLERHPAFPTIWRNLDTNRICIGDAMAVPDLSEMDIANHFQHNFGMEKVNGQLVAKCMMAIARRNQRSPMLDYIKGLRWDGVERLNTWMSDTWGVPDSDFVQQISSKWLISACARMDKPGSKVDWIFIVIGPQGTGKTSMPGILFKGNSLTLYGDNTDKDLHMLLHSALVVGFDELDSFSRKDASLLKAMITRSEDMFRPPYGASIEVFPRRFTLYGCGNRHEFLQSDPTGQRRYAIVEVDRLLDFHKLEEMRDQLWAEAWERYQLGSDKWWEITGASEEAKKYEVPSAVEDMVDEFLAKRSKMSKHAENPTAKIEFTMNEICNEMNIPNAKGSLVIREISGYLTSLGWKKKSVTVNGVTKRLYMKE